MWDWVHNWGIIREIIKRIYGPVPYSARWALRPFNLVNPKIIIRHSINWRYQPQLSFMHSASVDRGPSSLSFFSKKYSVFTSFSLCEWKNEDSFSILYDFLCFVWNDRGNTKRCKIKMLWYLWTRGFQFKQWIPAFSRRFHIFFYLYFLGGEVLLDDDWFALTTPKRLTTGYAKELSGFWVYEGRIFTWFWNWNGECLMSLCFMDLWDSFLSFIEWKMKIFLFQFQKLGFDFSRDLIF